MECEFKYSGCTGEGVETLDPYALEIHAREAYIVACGNCEREIAMDI